MLPAIRVMLVEDHRDWRTLVRLLFQIRPDLQIICEVADGLEAVQKAEELKPDLILLDISLPKLNGIEASRRIRQLSPNSKILFVSMDHSQDVVHAALATGAQGYVDKADGGSELLAAVEAALRGKLFVSSSIMGLPDTPRAIVPHSHEILFYPDDTVFLESCTRFAVAALGAGDVVAVVATGSHQDSLFHRLKAEGLDVVAEIKHGRYIPLEVAKTLSTFMVNDMPDWNRFFEVVGGLVREGRKAGKGENSRVAICGECGPFLWAQGKVDAAILLEQFANRLGTIYDFDLLCAYALSSLHREEDNNFFQSMCTEHSAVYSR